jgi:hypothetical protein
MLIPGQHWYASHRADPRACALFLRHYSADKNREYRAPGQTNFVAPGEPMVLLTPTADALFVWLKNGIERWDGQEGVICTVFRNEGHALSSTLIREADELAWQRWPGERHFTYVDPKKTTRRRGKTSQPGACFIHAGWRHCGQSKSGLAILERLPTG